MIQKGDCEGDNLRVVATVMANLGVAAQTRLIYGVQ